MNAKILSKFFKNHKIKEFYYHHLMMDNYQIEVYNETSELVALFRGDRKTKKGKLFIFV